MQIEHQFPKGKLQNQKADIVIAVNSIRLNIVMENDMII
jgi:hypothetical protein